MNTKSMLRVALPALAGLALGLAAPEGAVAQESGAEVWARSCGRCHRIQPPTKYDARHWDAIVGHMGLNARLTTEEEVAVKEFLMAAGHKYAAAPPEKGPKEVGQLASLDLSAVIAQPDTNGEEIFKKQCVACHGDSGEGDGPAAVAFNPKPANLTDSHATLPGGKSLGEMTDDELAKVLAEGKGAMPAFAALLSPEDIQALVEYIRALSKAP